VQQLWPQYLGTAWEDVSRQSVARLRIRGHRWQPGERWWGRAAELDIVACSATDPTRVLVGEAKLQCSAKEAERLLLALERKAHSCPALREKRISTVLFVLSWRGRSRRVDIVTAGDIVRSSA
jgi:hypothetical protein